MKKIHQVFPLVVYQTTIDCHKDFKEQYLQNLKDFYPLGYIGHVNEKGYKKIADILKESILN